jgi:hypothetical protein
MGVSPDRGQGDTELSCNFRAQLSGEEVHDYLQRCILRELLLPQSFQRLRKVDVPTA